jgi:hypothetical protein
MGSRRIKTHGYVVCVRNAGYGASLELRKLYPVVHDPDSEAHHVIRVIDESGEDYVYPNLPVSENLAARRTATGAPRHTLVHDSMNTHAYCPSARPLPRNRSGLEDRSLAVAARLREYILNRKRALRIPS